MFEVKVYDEDGEVYKTFDIDDDLEYIGGRVHKGKKSYYKGVGIPYKSHFVDRSKLSSEYTQIKSISGDVFYAGQAAIKDKFKNKTGIFLEKYQEFFPDAIGSCSVKEGPLVINSVIFEKSSVEVYDCKEIDVGDYKDKQYYYELDYLCKRKGYLEDNGDPKKLTELIDYMIQEDWNFLWDKATIRDISDDGRVTDVADLFTSNNLMHKLGSVYSLLYSLHHFDKNKFNDFIKVNNLKHPDARWFVFNSVLLLMRNGVNVTELNPDNLTTQNYNELVIHYIAAGKNCGHCSCDLFTDNGNKIRDQYIEQIKKQINYKSVV